MQSQFQGVAIGSLKKERVNNNGRLPEWPNGTDCKSVVARLRWFESTISHYNIEPTDIIGRFFVVRLKISGSSSVGRATAFQAVGRGFEPRLPLLILSGLHSYIKFCIFASAIAFVAQW